MSELKFTRYAVIDGELVPDENGGLYIATDIDPHLDALRRPVGQSAEVESIRATIAELKHYWAGNPGDVPYNLTRYFEHGDILLSDLDQAQQEIAELKDRDFCEMDGDEPPTHVMANGRICVQCWNRVCEAKHKLADEIARLSSPPQERKEIPKVSVYAVSKEHGQWYVTDSDGEKSQLEQGDEYCDSIAVGVIETLQQDLARYRNAHAILMAERDEARKQVGLLEALQEAMKDCIVDEGSEMSFEQRAEELIVTEVNHENALARVAQLTGELDLYASSLQGANASVSAYQRRVERLERELSDLRRPAVTGVNEMDFIRQELNDAKRFAFAGEPLQPSMAKTVLACADQVLMAYNDRCMRIQRLEGALRRLRDWAMVTDRGRYIHNPPVDLIDPADELLGDHAPVVDVRELAAADGRQT